MTTVSPPWDRPQRYVGPDYDFYCEEDRKHWLTCSQCGFVGPHVGYRPTGEPACMGIFCGGKHLNPLVPRMQAWPIGPILGVGNTEAYHGLVALGNHFEAWGMR